MKANPRSRTIASRSLPSAVFSTAILAGLLAGCVPPAPTSSAPPPLLQPSRQPEKPVSSQTVTPPPAPVGDWRNVPATSGNWTFATSPSGTVSTFANGLFSLRCNLSAQTITINRAGAYRAGSVSMGITTTNTSRTLSAQSTQNGIQVTLPARDPLLDAMAISRGRFFVTVSGEQPLYIPSWVEVTRVIEDCR